MSRIDDALRLAWRSWLGTVFPEPEMAASVESFAQIAHGFGDRFLEFERLDLRSVRREAPDMIHNAALDGGEVLLARAAGGSERAKVAIGLQQPDLNQDDDHLALSVWNDKYIHFLFSLAFGEAAE